MGCGASAPQATDTPQAKPVVQPRDHQDDEVFGGWGAPTKEGGSRKQASTGASGKGRATAPAGPKDKQDAPGGLFVAAKKEAEDDTVFQTFKAVVTVGVQATWQLADTFKGCLPFPGGEALELISAMAGFVHTSIVNKENLESLQARACELMDVLIEKHLSELERGSGKEAKPSPKYKYLMTQLRDLLQEIVGYAQGYTDRNIVMRLLMTTNDRDFHEEKVQQLSELIADATFAVVVDTHTLVGDVKADVKAMMELIKAQTPYKDTSSEVRALVESLGGVSMVTKDADKVRQVAKSLSISAQLNLAAHEQLQASLSAGFKAAAADNDVGVHRQIRHTDMRTFWKIFFNGLDRVTWDTWWGAFPECMDEIIDDKALVKQLVTRFSDPAARKAFQEVIDREDTSTIGVTEVKVAFPADADLWGVIEKMTTKPGAPASSARARAARLWGVVEQAAGAAQSDRKGQRAAAKHAHSRGVRFELPELNPLYDGRAADAKAVVGQLQQQQLTRPIRSSLSGPGSGALAGGGAGAGAVCLVGGEGVGKSALGLDVAWRMAEAGACPAGAIMVDLRAARTLVDVQSRMCHALDVPMDDHATKKIFSRLTSLCATHKGPLLMLVDNAEDCMQGPDAAHCCELFDKIATDAVLVLASATAAPGCKVFQHELRGMDGAACSRLVQHMAPGLKEPEAREVAQLCGGSPLLARLAADALASGRLNVQDMRAAGKGKGVVDLALGSLKPQQRQSLQQLTVFPSGFSDQAAAAVLGVPESRVHPMLQNMEAHGLVQANTFNLQHSLHSAVRSSALAAADPAQLQECRARFVDHTFTQLGEWAGMYNAPTWPLANRLAREHSADVAVAFDVAQQLLPPTPANTPKEGDTKWGVLRTVLSLEPSAMTRLMGTTGSYVQSTWGKLKHLGEYCTTDNMRGMRASACMVEHAVHDAHGTPEAHAAAAEAAARARELRAGLLGPEHPLTMASMAAMGESVQKQITGGPGGAGVAAGEGGAKAEALLSEVLEMRKKVLGPDHLDTTESANSLANNLRKQGRFDEAEALYSAALEARKKALGPMHPETVASTIDLAMCVSTQGRYKEAEPLYQAALAARQQTYGPDHPSTIASAANLASCIADQKRASHVGDLRSDRPASGLRTI